MIARPSAPQRSANAGEFSPDVAGRVDIKQYYSAGLRYKRVEPVPQGGFRQMGGTRRKGFWRKPLETLAIGSPALDAGPHEGTQTVWTGTVAGTVAAVLVTGFSITDGSATFSVEASAGGDWTALSGPFAVAAGVAETRFAASAPGEGQAATALRIQATFSESATVAISDVDAFSENGTAQDPRFVALTDDDGTAFAGFVTAGIADFFTEDGFQGSARLAAVTAAMLPDLDFYAEANTIGVFHQELETVRLVKGGGGDADWQADLWPYDPVPQADLGGDYPKTDDVWEIFIRWTGTVELYLSITVDDETTPAVPHTDAMGDPIDSGSWDDTTWAGFAADLQEALEGLPSLGTGVTVAQEEAAGTSRKLTVTFGGDFSGEEFGLSALVTNTADASALPYHTAIGETEQEDLFSAGNGWPGTATLVQDRLAYAKIPAVSGAMATSRVGEYFDLNAAGQGDAAARLDKLRSQTSETILHVFEGDYLFVLTDRGVYFVPNRTIERNTPLNFVRSSEVGAQPNAKPFELDGILQYIAINPKGLPNAAAGGKQLMRVTESPVTNQVSYDAAGASLLATHLVDQVIRTARQKPENDLDAARGWLMRADGRLVCCQAIASQEITGFCEWVPADGASAAGAVSEIGVDGKNLLWLAIERGAERTIELYDTGIFFDDAIEAADDLAGRVEDLPYADGSQLHAVADGFVLGPFTVADSAIDLEDPYEEILVGRWRAPVWESMPQVFVTGNDDVVWRPGRIHTAHLNVIDTSSIAVGANGSDVQNVTLAEAGDPVDAPVPARTRLITVSGADLPGFSEGTTLVVTQVRPGTLRVRDHAIGAKL